MSEFEISPIEANRWWQKNTVAGVFLNRLMLLFVILPIALVFKEFYKLSFAVFALMVPYGLVVRQLAVRAVRQLLVQHPELIDEFQEQGIISR